PPYSALRPYTTLFRSFRCNAEVTMAVREPWIKDSVKYWVKPDIENRIRSGEVKAYFNTTVTEIREHEVDLMTEDGPITIENDFRSEEHTSELQSRENL